ncbi:MAG: hypothetical protein ACRD44_13855 [Bryobacteraceae bacterium]
MNSSTAWLLALSIALGAAGAWIGGFRSWSRAAIAISGVLLIGVALFAALPEIAESLGWARAAAAVGGGVGLLWVTNRYLYPVCPICADSHDHAGCERRLHGFAAPLAIAAGLHNLLDGWAAAWSSQSAKAAAVTVMTGLLLHKGAEAIALGAILRASLGSASAAFLALVSVQAPMAIGALAEGWAPPEWASGLLALTAGSFLFLGFHAMHSGWSAAGAPARLAPPGS